MSYLSTEQLLALIFALKGKGGEPGGEGEKIRNLTVVKDPNTGRYKIELTVMKPDGGTKVFSAMLPESELSKEQIEDILKLIQNITINDQGTVLINNKSISNAGFTGSYEDLINKPDLSIYSKIKVKIEGEGNAIVNASLSEDLTLLTLTRGKIDGGGPLDDEMSDTSENAVKNNVIKRYVDKIPVIEVDETVTDSGTNPVEGRGVKKYVDDKIAKIPIVEVDETISDEGVNPVEGRGVKKYVDEKFQERMQYTVMPEPTSELAGMIYQYIGQSTSEFKTGYFYSCSFIGGKHKWLEISFGGLIESIEASKVTFDNTTSSLISANAQDALVELTQMVERGFTIDDEVIKGSTNAVSSNGVYNGLLNKVDKVSGYKLSKNDFTDAYKNKLEGLGNGMVLQGRVSKESDLPKSPAIGDMYLVGEPSATSFKKEVFSKQGWVYLGYTDLRIDGYITIDENTKHWKIGETDTGVSARGIKPTVTPHENTPEEKGCYLDIDDGEGHKIMTPDLKGKEGEKGRPFAIKTAYDNARDMAEHILQDLESGEFCLLRNTGEVYLRLGDETLKWTRQGEIIIDVLFQGKLSKTGVYNLSNPITDYKFLLVYAGYNADNGVEQIASNMIYTGLIKYTDNPYRFGTNISINNNTRRVNYRFPSDTQIKIDRIEGAVLTSVIGIV